MPIPAALDKQSSATIGVDGRAVIVMNPDRARESWKVDRYQCHSNSVLATKLTVYKGSEQAGSRIDFTNRGNDDVSENFNAIEIPSHGLPLRFVWENGTPGAIVEINVFGQLQIG